MSTARDLIEKFYGKTRADEEARALMLALDKQPAATVAEEYVRFYNERDPKSDWHFRWLFGRITLKNQLDFVDAALSRPAETRTAFDKRLLEEDGLLDLLNIPEDHPHRTTLEIFGSGWKHCADIYGQNTARREHLFRDVLRAVRILVE
jgi:hypothetical protein